MEQSLVSYHICPLGACNETWEEYWKDGLPLDRIGSSPTTPRPLTVSRVPDKENILQFLSLKVTVCSPKFSRRMQYLHYKLKSILYAQSFINEKY